MSKIILHGETSDVLLPVTASDGKTRSINTSRLVIEVSRSFQTKRGGSLEANRRLICESSHSHKKQALIYKLIFAGEILMVNAFHLRFYRRNRRNNADILRQRIVYGRIAVSMGLIIFIATYCGLLFWLGLVTGVAVGWLPCAFLGWVSTMILFRFTKFLLPRQMALTGAERV